MSHFLDKTADQSSHLRLFGVQTYRLSHSAPIGIFARRWNRRVGKDMWGVQQAQVAWTPTLAIAIIVHAVDCQLAEYTTLISLQLQIIF